MNGAFGVELIQYTGFQTVKESDGDIGRRVYLSVNKFNATSDLHIRRDGIKEVYFTDNNGNVRVVIDSNNNIKKYDYKPFGELYWSSDGSHLREGLEGSIFDPESELQMMGFRIYDTETGRFTTPDLLWSAFPSHTPYHYAYNSPMIWSDPSGLAPEKERDREKLLNIELDWEGDYNVWNEIQYENGRVAMMQYKSYIMDFKEAFKTRFGESSGSRTGASKTYHGVSLRIGITGFVEGINYNYTTHKPTSRGILDVPTTVQDNAISSGETHESVMNAFIGGINDALKADSKFFDNVDSGMLIYPNPATDIINVPFDNYEVYNSFGMLMGNYSSSQLDVSGFPAGAYFVKGDSFIFNFIKD